MHIREAFRQGRSRGYRNFRVILILYLSNLIFAIIAAFPAYTLLDNSIGYSTVGEELRTNFNLEFVIDFLHFNSVTLKTFLTSTGYITILFFVTTTFLLGGMLDIIKEQETPFSFLTFFSGCARYFFRFVKLILYAVPFLIGIYYFSRLVDLILKELFEDSIHEILFFWLSRFNQLLTVFLILMLGMILDYAKIRTALEDRIVVRRTLFLTVGFIFRNLSKTIKLYYYILMWELIVFSIFFLLFYSVLPDTSVVPLIILQQVLLFIQVWFRVAFFGSEIALYNSLTPQTALKPVTKQTEPADSCQAAFSLSTT